MLSADELLDRLKKTSFANEFELEQVINENPVIMGEVYRALSVVVGQLSRTENQLNILEADLISNYILDYEKKKQKDFPLSGLNVLKKTILYSDENYKNLNELKSKYREDRVYIEGLAKAFESRSYSLNGLKRGLEKVSFYANQMTEVNHEDWNN